MSGEFGKRNSECGIQGGRAARVLLRTIPSQTGTSFRNPQSTIRTGVTLVELLITITIVSILSAAFLGTSNLAMESSRKARTKTTIGKIHGLLMEKWSEYSTRRVDISPAVLADVAQLISTNVPTVQQQRALGVGRADLRLLATRELMKMEMPDRWSDILGNTVAAALPTASDASFNEPSVLIARPGLSNTYLRRYRSLPTVDEEKLLANQGAECLYLTIMLATADGEARTLFSENDIGDTDDDGAPEFLDGWGRPISYIRWPAGFVLRSDLMSGDADLDHDPLDPFRQDRVGNTALDFSLFPNTGSPTVQSMINQVRVRNNTNILSFDGAMVPVGAFRLLPLIFSSGADGISDISIPASGLNGADPYVIDTSVSAFLFGLPADINNDGDDNSLDNIHNHLQDNK